MLPEVTWTDLELNMHVYLCLHFECTRFMYFFIYFILLQQKKYTQTITETNRAEEKLKESNKILDELRVGIHTMFKRLGCDPRYNWNADNCNCHAFVTFKMIL